MNVTSSHATVQMQM